MTSYVVESLNPAGELPAARSAIALSTCVRVTTEKSIIPD
jgi:hypothetical protein